MQPDEYQALAMRTRCPQHAPLERLAGQLLLDPNCRDAKWHGSIQVNHAVIGLMGEVGEMASTIERWVYYGESLDRKNMFEEAGDALWYIAELCDALGFNMEEVMKANISKLRARYPDKYTDKAAAEENRNRTAEAVALNSNRAETQYVITDLEPVDLVLKKVYQDMQDMLRRVQLEGNLTEIDFYNDITAVLKRASAIKFQ